MLALFNKFKNNIMPSNEENTDRDSENSDQLDSDSESSDSDQDKTKDKERTQEKNQEKTQEKSRPQTQFHFQPQSQLQLQLQSRFQSVPLKFAEVKAEVEYVSKLIRHPNFYSEQIILASDLLNFRESVKNGGMKPGVDQRLESKTSFEFSKTKGKPSFLDICHSPFIFREVSDYKNLYAFTFFYYELDPKNLWKLPAKDQNSPTFAYSKRMALEQSSSMVLNYEIHSANVFIKIKANGYHTYSKLIRKEEGEEVWVGLYRLSQGHFTKLDTLIAAEMDRHEKNSRKFRPQNISISFKELIDRKETLIQIANKMNEKPEKSSKVQPKKGSKVPKN